MSEGILSGRARRSFAWGLSVVLLICSAGCVEKVGPDGGRAALKAARGEVVDALGDFVVVAQRVGIELERPRGRSYNCSLTAPSPPGAAYRAGMDFRPSDIAMREQLQKLTVVLVVSGWEKVSLETSKDGDPLLVARKGQVSLVVLRLRSRGSAPRGPLTVAEVHLRDCVTATDSVAEIWGDGEDLSLPGVEDE